MSPMEQLAKQEYERGYSDGKSDYFAAGVAEGEMRARQRMIANRVVANQHPFAASGKPIDHIASTGKMIGCAYCDNPLFAGTKCNNCGRVTLAEPVKQEPVGYTAQSVIDWLSSDERTDVAEAEIRLKKKPSGRSNVPLYAAPVDAIAIRAEALEEAAKVYEEYAHLLGLETDCAAAIRGLK